ncbi:phage EaA protein [Klebsiella pneumoniae]|uniref:Phage EaA protein n=1 Tax=Klebsiella pneumoniae TaxID=573 RepID=A0A2X3I2W1_KLEPN|nr:phage EaA protein [Klebsiella pneumoniae]STR97623.1 phage EaA protein [Klebsiella pneumoniae]STR99196.1 phage EaA protein [Klebsiella pneumoniae]HBY9792921.1 ead/Ea22-like family protein [Klebsiella pneumoniae]HDU1554378.1 ead/Ea22-like family protein [Klebsiella pneumoniae]
MTTDITELAHRLKLEVHRAVSNFSPQMNIKTRDLKELVEVLEKTQAKADVYDMLRDDYGLREKGVGLADFVDWQANRIAELEAQNEYIRKRYQQLDLLIGKNILVMQAAIIEWQATGDAKNGLAWIYNTLFGPGELPDEAEKDAQAYFDRKYAPLDEELMVLHKWFWEQSEAERAAAGIKVG